MCTWDRKIFKGFIIIFDVLFSYSGRGFVGIGTSRVSSKRWLSIYFTWVDNPGVFNRRLGMVWFV